MTGPHTMFDVGLKINYSGHALKALDTFGIVKDHFSHLVYLNIFAYNNKPVKMWTQFGVEVARKEEILPLAHKFYASDALSETSDEISYSNPIF